MTITLNYCGQQKQGFLQLEDRRFDINIDLDYEELLDLKEQLDEVIKLIKEENNVEPETE